jgi:hypothetical protein
MKDTTLAGALAGHFDAGQATVDELTRKRLASLITVKGYTLTGIARAMGKSHTWLLRKLDPTQGTIRPCTLEDVGEVLAFLKASSDELIAAA